MRNAKFFKGLVIVLMVIGFYVGLNAFIMLNGIPPCDGEKAIERLTVDAASYFLQSNADALLLLSEIEISGANGLNYVRALEFTESAIEKLEKARADYLEMNVVSKSPCDKAALIEKLQAFDYGRLAGEQQLNKEIMSLVASYLVKGDIPGVYEKTASDVNVILSGLYEMRDLLKKDVQPGLDSCWTLLRRYSDTLLFGNYVTLVFYHL